MGLGRVAMVRNPLPDDAASDAQTARRLNEADLLAVDRDRISLAGIGLLLCRGRPTAIRQLVIAVVVDAIDCRSYRAFTHVCQEVGKLEPAVTHPNAAPTVASVAGGFGRTAAREH